MKKLNCDFCGKEIECPEHMLNSKKHVCFECFDSKKEELVKEEVGKLHVDIPPDKAVDFISDNLVDLLLDDVFPNLWKEAKKDVKEMSKREVSEAMFASGAGAALCFVMDSVGGAEFLRKTKEK